MIKIDNEVKQEVFMQHIKRRLNALAMCKRGSLESEKNSRLIALGERPLLTSAEKKERMSKLAPKIKKAMTPTLADVKKYTVRELAQVLKDRADKIAAEVYHNVPGERYDKKRRQIKDEISQRIALLDADFKDLEDQYFLQLLDPTDFPQHLLKLEEREW